MNELTAERLRHWLTYDPLTGLFMWRVKPKGAKAVVGSNCRNYLVIGIEGSAYLAHRLAWLYMTGAWPTGMIDHMNGMTMDNRFSNLRDATKNINAQNLRRAATKSKTGVLGVVEIKGRFEAKIKVNRRTLYLGRFGSAEDAYAAYVEAKRRLHPGCTL